MSRTRRVIRWVAMALAGLAVLDAALCLAYNRAVGAYVQPPPAGRTFDAVVIFYADFGLLGYRTQPLLEDGAALLASGAARRLICAGGNRPASGREGCARAREWLVARGVPAERIDVDRVSRDTLGNVRAAALLARQMDARSLILLSHSWHAPRVRAIAAAELPGIETFSMSPSLDRWGRSLYWWEAWRSTHYEAASWIIWKAFGEGAHDALVRTLRP